MNKKFAFLITSVILLTACEQSDAMIRTSDSTYNNPMVTLIAEEPYGYIIAYDKDTMVMYIGKHNGEGNATNNDSGNTTNTDTSKDLYSDTPQGSLQNVDNETYLTNARKIIDSKNETRTNTSTSKSTETSTLNDAVDENITDTYNENTTRDKTGNSKLNSTDAYVETIRGKSGGASYSKLLEEFRRTFMNIDVQIINDLNDLFFGLW